MPGRQAVGQKRKNLIQNCAKLDHIQSTGLGLSLIQMDLPALLTQLLEMVNGLVDDNETMKNEIKALQEMKLPATDDAAEKTPVLTRLGGTPNVFYPFLCNICWNTGPGQCDCEIDVTKTKRKELDQD
jgi:hypothetical protein